MTLRSQILAPGLFAALCALGCGASEEKLPIEPLVPVGGKLLVDGKPLDGVVITFIPDGNKKGPGGSGTTDSAGAFTITDLHQKKPGLPVGKYKLTYSRRRLPDGSAAPALEPGATPDPAKIQVETFPDHLTTPNPSNQTEIPAGGKADLALSISTKG